MLWVSDRFIVILRPCPRVVVTWFRSEFSFFFGKLKFGSLPRSRFMRDLPFVLVSPRGGEFYFFAFPSFYPLDPSRPSLRAVAPMSRVLYGLGCSKSIVIFDACLFVEVYSWSRQVCVFFVRGIPG